MKTEEKKKVGRKKTEDPAIFHVTLRLRKSERDFLTQFAKEKNTNLSELLRIWIKTL